MRIKNYTLSLCPECFKLLEAKVVVEDDVVYIVKKCDIHGDFKYKHVWDSEKVYENMSSLYRRHPQPANGLVLSITNRCNIKCRYCFARSNEILIPELNSDEIKRILMDYNGEIVYFSGGEPTIREDLFSYIELAKKKRFKTGLFTNGKKLFQKKYVEDLKKAGLDFVIIQFDTLEDSVGFYIYGESLCAYKKKALEHLEFYRIPVYLFVVLIKNYNTDEIKSLLDFVFEKNNCIKIINFNPIWETGRIAEHEDFTSSMIIDALEKQSGITQEDLLDSTKFAFLLFDFLQRLKCKNNNVHPRCELRTYVIYHNKKIIPITRMFDVKLVNGILESILKRKKDTIELYIFLLIFSFYIFEFLLSNFFKNSNFRILLKVFLKNIFNANFHFRLMQLSPFTSIIVGTFQTVGNVDFDLLKTCNLYANIPGKETIFSACVRQMLLNSVPDFSEFKSKRLAKCFADIKKYVFDKKIDEKRFSV